MSRAQPPTAPQEERKGSSTMGSLAGQLVGLVITVVVWEMGVRIFQVPKFILPTPTDVLLRLIEVPGYFAGHTVATLGESLLGFAIGALVAIASAIAITYSRLLRQAVYPVMIMFNTVPKVALAPLFVIWFGYGLTSKIIIAFTISFFPVLVNGIDGLRSVPEEMLELSRSLHASNWDEFRKVRFPNAMPYIFTGMKVSISMAVTGAVVGEFVGGKSGLGYVIVSALAGLDIPAQFGAVMILSLMAIVFFTAMELLERTLIPWAFVGKE